MAVSSFRVTTVTFTGDINGSFPFAVTTTNTNSPGSVTIHTLSAGFNAITLPGATVQSATIIPPSGNAQSLTLKGVTGDTGIGLHLTDPSTVTFSTTPPATIGITAGGTVTNLRIVWG